MDDDKAQLEALGATVLAPSTGAPVSVWASTAHRCGSPRCPHAHEDECAAEHATLREELATVTAERDALAREVEYARTMLAPERDALRSACVTWRGRTETVEQERAALRGALVALVTAHEALGAAMVDHEDMRDVEPYAVALDGAWAHALDVLGRVTP